MPPKLVIKRFELGEWMTNCYVIHVDAQRDVSTGGSAAADVSRPCWIIDAGFEPYRLAAYIREQKLAPQAVLLTHAHLDHIAGLSDLREKWPDLPILIHRAEEAFLGDPMLNLSVVLEEPLLCPPATGFLEHGQSLDIAGLRCEVRHTPGHSPGGVTFYFAQQGVAFVGDTLFAGSVGRTDFPTSDHELLFESIRSQLLTLPDSTRVLPGHGPETTIGKEKRSNPFL